MVVSVGWSVGYSDGRSVGNQLFFCPTRSNICRVYGMVNFDEATVYEGMSIVILSQEKKT